MKRILSSPWSTASLGVIAYCLTTWFALAPAKLLSRVQTASASTVQTLSGPAPSWNFYSTELDQLLAEVRDEREALKNKAQQLNDFQARLEAERQEICAVTQKVALIQKELDNTLIRVKENEQANLKKLAKMYSTMTPEGASEIVKELDEEQAVKVMAVMKESESAAILEVLAKDGGADAKRAATLMNRLRLLVPAGPAAKPQPK